MPCHGCMHVADAVPHVFSGVARTYMGYSIGPYTPQTCGAGLREVKIEQITYDVTGHVPVIDSL